MTKWAGSDQYRRRWVFAEIAEAAVGMGVIRVASRRMHGATWAWSMCAASFTQCGRANRPSPSSARPSFVGHCFPLAGAGRPGSRAAHLGWRQIQAPGATSRVALQVSPHRDRPQVRARPPAPAATRRRVPARQAARPAERG